MNQPRKYNHSQIIHQVTIINPSIDLMVNFILNHVSCFVRFPENLTNVQSTRVADHSWWVYSLSLIPWSTTSCWKLRHLWRARDRSTHTGPPHVMDKGCTRGSNVCSVCMKAPGNITVTTARFTNELHMTTRSKKTSLEPPIVSIKMVGYSC